MAGDLRHAAGSAQPGLTTREFPMLFQNIFISSPKCPPPRCSVFSTGRSQVCQITTSRSTGRDELPASASPGRRTWSRYDGNLEPCRAAQRYQCTANSLPDPVRFTFPAQRAVRPWAVTVYTKPACVQCSATSKGAGQAGTLTRRLISAWIPARDYVDGASHPSWSPETTTGRFPAPIASRRHLPGSADAPARQT